MIAESTTLITPDAAVKFLWAANILYLVCYGVRDVLWLRIFCVTAIITIMPYYVWGIDGLVQWSCIGWNFLFFAINMFWIVVIIRQRRPPKMNADQRQLYEDVFEKGCTPQEMLKLLSIAKYESVQPGDKLIAKLTSPNGLRLIQSGRAEVVVDSNIVAELGRGDFVGEMSYLTGEAAVADVVALDPVRYVSWSTDDLKKLFEGRAGLNSALNRILGIDLVRKLTTTEETLVPELAMDSTLMKTE